MYLSYISDFTESTVETTEKQKAKQIQQKKKIYRNVEGKPLPIVFDYVLPIRQSSFSFLFFLSQLALKLYPYLVAPFTIKGREHTCSFSAFFLFFFFFFF